MMLLLHSDNEEQLKVLKRDFILKVILTKRKSFSTLLIYVVRKYLLKLSVVHLILMLFSKKFSMVFLICSAILSACLKNLTENFYNKKDKVVNYFLNHSTSFKSFLLSSILIE